MASAGSPVSGSGSQCALITLVSSDSDEASADIYVAKEGPDPTLPEDPTLEDLWGYANEVIAHAISYTSGTEPTSNSGDVQVELVFPANPDAETDGYRASFIVNLSNCSLS